MDSEGGVTDAQTTVVVNKMTHAVPLTNNGPVDEGSPATVKFNNASDVSSVDRASLHFFFSTDKAARDSATYATSGATSSRDFTFNDNGSYTVYGRILDKDGGVTDKQTTVTVNNV